MARLLRGAPVAAQIVEEVAERAAALAERGTVPTLAVVRVGEAPGDLAYERGILKRAERCGVAVRREVFAEDVTQAELLACVERLNADAAVHGCLVFRPLPASLDEEALCGALAPEKDMDGITPGALYGVFADRAVGFAPCTAEAVVELLERSDVPLEGARVCVVGRSLVIGRPVSLMLLARNATVTMCHTRTRDLDTECARADVLVVAAGHAATVGAAAVRPGQTVVDVGINADPVTGALVGDVAFGEVEPVVDAITPVPGGVGAVTTAVLLRHVIEAAERSLATGVDM